MICKHCNANNDASAKFCRSCGAELSAVQPNAATGTKANRC